MVIGVGTRVKVLLSTEYSIKTSVGYESLSPVWMTTLSILVSLGNIIPTDSFVLLLKLFQPSLGSREIFFPKKVELKIEVYVMFPIVEPIPNFLTLMLDFMIFKYLLLGLGGTTGLVSLGVGLGGEGMGIGVGVVLLKSFGSGTYSGSSLRGGRISKTVA
jgi:hypothetical protein